jgi:HD-GYP domain-containing protein (c-di-GMP phosphodiesterase class II)/putative methionine-R-sulfoxide reductase with GAF domain
MLVQMARIAREAVRGSDVVCRIGGEEFGVIMPSCDAGDALGLGARLAEKLREFEFEPSGLMTVSMGVAQGPEHAMNPRELVACAEAAMMTAKAHGKNQCVVYDDGATERPSPTAAPRDVRSIAHLKMLQSLAGKLNRLNDVAQIGNTIATELRLLIDYHNCRVVLRDGDDLRPIAFVGDYSDSVTSTADAYSMKVGVGVTGRAVERGEALLVPNALECEFAYRIPGTDELEESLAVVPLRYGARVTGAIVISKLGVNQFDDDDVRLLEVLAGQASVALENARLYEQQRREAEGAKALLRLADEISQAHTVEEICALAVEAATRLFETERASLWLGDACVAAIGDELVDGASAPLAEGDGITGRVVVDVPRLDDDRERLLASFAYQLSVALQKARLYAKQMEAAEIANALLEAGRELATAESPEEVLGRSAEVTARVLNTRRASLWIQEEGDPHELVARASYGYEREFDPAGRRRYPACVAQEWLARGEPFMLEPADLGAVEGVDAAVIERSVVAPLRLEGNRVGALVATIGDRHMDDRQLRLLAGLAHQAKLAIESAEHFEGLERTFVATVATLANALEANDEYTSTHARWITDMAMLVGRALQLDRDAMKRLELGALFHDIGKIGIPSEILRKPGPLTDEEFAIVKEHPELGERILAPIDRLADVRPIVRACHERWDGLGYPDGRAGTDIPIEARIVLVCDAFHAMTTDRPYRRRLSTEEAVSRLVEASGTQFDPHVVDTFIRLYESGDVLPLG